MTKVPRFITLTLAGDPHTVVRVRVNAKLIVSYEDFCIAAVGDGKPFTRNFPANAKTRFVYLNGSEVTSLLATEPADHIDAMLRISE